MDNFLFKTKLQDWKRAIPETLKVGQHIRVTSNRYREPGRKCSHVVIQTIDDDGNIFVNSYGEKKYSDWKLKPQCQYKQEKYYIRAEPMNIHTGKCISCKEEPVSLPYWKCIYCKNNPAPKSD